MKEKKGSQNMHDLQSLEITLKELNKKWLNSNLTTEKLIALEKDIEDTELLWSEASQQAGTAPLVSVVMSVYNTEKYIGAALDSILRQTFCNFEIVLIDDGSSDKSIEIARSYRDSRIRIIHQTNHGLVYSFNKGIRLSRGTFIARMDADDICMPSRFEKELIWLMAKPNRGMVGTFFRYIDQESAKPLDVIQTSPLKHVDIVRMMYIVNPFAHGSVMYRKDAVMDVGVYDKDYEPSEDYDLWRRIALKWEIGQIPEVLYFWRFQTSGLGNISQRKRKESNDSAARTVQNMWSGPVFYKSIRSIIRDGKILLHNNGSLGGDLYNQYVEHQFRLYSGFLKRRHRRHIRAGIATMIGVTFLAPKLSVRRIWFVLPSAIIKNIVGR